MWNLHEINNMKLLKFFTLIPCHFTAAKSISKSCCLHSKTLPPAYIGCRKHHYVPMTSSHANLLITRKTARLKYSSIWKTPQLQSTWEWDSKSHQITFNTFLRSLIGFHNVNCDYQYCNVGQDLKNTKEVKFLTAILQGFFNSLGISIQFQFCFYLAIVK